MPAQKRRKLKLKDFRAKLEAEREDLTHLAQVSEEFRLPVELDQSTVGRLSRMDALQAQAMALETDRRRTVELRRIDSALKRIEEGEYGCCVSCGEEIQTKRLENDPTTPTCIDCATLSDEGR